MGRGAARVRRPARRMLGNGSGASRVRARAHGPLQVSQNRSVRAGSAEDSDGKNPKVCPSRDAAGDCEAVDYPRAASFGAAIEGGRLSLTRCPAGLRWSSAAIPLSLLQKQTCRRGCCRASARIIRPLQSADQLVPARYHIRPHTQCVGERLHRTSSA